MTLSKSGYVDIKPGQIAVVFQQPFGPYDRSLKDHMERFVNRGGGWDTFRADELFEFHLVCNVAPNTYKAHLADADILETSLPRRYPRSHVVAGTDTKLDALILRNQLFLIGEVADNRVDAEMYRLIAPFEKQEREYARQQIHGLLPHIFGETV